MTTVQSWALAVSAAGVIIGTAWSLSTFVLSEPVLPLWAAFVLLAGIAPIHIRTVILAQRARDRLGMEWVKRRLTRWRYLVGIALFVALWAFAITALVSLRIGGPEIVDGQFFANNHGSLTPISEARFHHLQLAEQRLLSAAAAWFYLFGVLVNLPSTRELLTAAASTGSSPRRRAAAS